MSEKRFTKPDGNPDLHDVQPGDAVVIEGARRQIQFDAGQVLNTDREPIASALDGSSEQLDGGRTMMLGGEVIARTYDD